MLKSLVLVVSLACALSTMGAACPRRSTFPSLEGLTDAQATARVLGAAARRERMVGMVKAKLPGLQGVVMSANLDVLLERPARVRVEVRSFFEQPMQVLATDGAVVTIFDASNGEAVFMRGAATPTTITKVLPIPLYPEEVVEVFLAHPPDGARGRLVSVDDEADPQHGGTYDVWLEAPNHAPCQVTVRAVDDAIVRWRHFKRDGRPLLDVTYGDLRAVGDVVVPFAWTVTLIDRTPNETLVFVGTAVEWNGEPRPDSDFHLDPPPGVDVRPL